MIKLEIVQDVLVVIFFGTFLGGTEVLVRKNWGLGRVRGF